MFEDVKIGSIGVDGDDKTTKKPRLTSKNLNRATSYLTPNSKQAFTQLRQAFTKVLILQYFNSRCHI